MPVHTAPRGPGFSDYSESSGIGGSHAQALTASRALWLRRQGAVQPPNSVSNLVLFLQVLMCLRERDSECMAVSGVRMLSLQGCRNCRECVPCLPPMLSLLSRHHRTTPPCTDILLGASHVHNGLAPATDEGQAKGSFYLSPPQKLKSLGKRERDSIRLVYRQAGGAIFLIND